MEISYSSAGVSGLHSIDWCEQYWKFNLERLSWLNQRSQIRRMLLLLFPTTNMQPVIWKTGRITARQQSIRLALCFDPGMFLHRTFVIHQSALCKAIDKDASLVCENDAGQTDWFWQADLSYTFSNNCNLESATLSCQCYSRTWTALSYSMFTIVYRLSVYLCVWSTATICYWSAYQLDEIIHFGKKKSNNPHSSSHAWPNQNDCVALIPTMSVSMHDEEMLWKCHLCVTRQVWTQTLGSTHSKDTHVSTCWR